MAENIITEIFSYKLPWILNGISKKLRNVELDNHAELIEEISLLIEIGLPDLKTVKIYQAGIRSRIYAKECASLFPNEQWDKSIRDYKSDLVINKESYKKKVSSKCGEWIDLLFNMTNSKAILIDRIPNFNFGKVHEKTSILLAKEINSVQHLISPDFSVIHDVSNSDIDFSSINKIQGVFFKYDPDDKVWKMEIENPYVKTY